MGYAFAGFFEVFSFQVILGVQDGILGGVHL